MVFAKKRKIGLIVYKRSVSSICSKHELCKTGYCKTGYCKTGYL